jgi:hypothetical protein
MSDNDKACDPATQTAWCRPVLGKADFYLPDAEDLAKEFSAASALELRKMCGCRPRPAAKRLGRSCGRSPRRSKRPTSPGP